MTLRGRERDKPLVTGGNLGATAAHRAADQAGCAGREDHGRDQQPALEAAASGRCPGATACTRRTPRRPAQATERRSARPLLYLHQLPTWVAPLVLAVLLIAGLAVTGPGGAVALCGVAAVLGWLAAVLAAAVAGRAAGPGPRRRWCWPSPAARPIR